MGVTRREFVAAGGLAAIFGTWSCGGSSSGGSSSEESLARLALTRGGYGPAPGDVAALQRRGLASWLEGQLDSESIDDSANDAEVAKNATYNLSAEELEKHSHVEVQLDLGRVTALRALGSKRQLHESLVEFWSDHFHMFLGKLPYLSRLRVVYDRDVLRKHALGRVADLVHETARSPAMLVSLDNAVNIASNPNENYARELMELHTLGVDAGYTQDDVEELARALTGWGVNAEDRFHFDEENHDTGSKTVFGHFVPGGGMHEVEQLIDHFTTSPQAARFIATKMVRRFVADDPPPRLVDRVASRYLETGGDIKALVRVIFLSPEFASAPRKLKRPYHYAISSMRALGLTKDGIDVALQHVVDMGHPLHYWPRPDGYPDVSEPWKAGLLARWNWCLTFLDGQQGAVNDAVLHRTQHDAKAADAVDRLAREILGRDLEDRASEALREYVGSGPPGDNFSQTRLRDTAALLLAHPEFQWA